MEDGSKGALTPIDLVVFSYVIAHLQPEYLTRSGLLNRLMIDLHRFNRLPQISGMPFDMDGVTDPQRPFVQLNDRNGKVGVIMGHDADRLLGRRRRGRGGGCGGGG